VSLTTAIAALDDLVATTAAEHHCPTISWAVTVSGHTAASGSFGTLTDGSAPTVDTVYRIASMTKSFTAAAVLALRDDGVLDLDARIADLVPEFGAIVGPTADAAPITLRHLMSMAAGFANDDAWADRHLDMSSSQLDSLLHEGAVFAVATGTDFEYSNLGFAMLGRVVHAITGTPVQEVITKRLLGSLDLSRTSWVMPGHDDWAHPFHVVDGAAAPDPVAPLGDGAFAPMGGLWSSAADLCRWMRWLDDAHPPRDDDDVSPLRRASRREMQQMQRYSGTKALAGRSAPTGYGYGLMLRDDPTLGRIVSHSGGLPGYGSNMRWLAGRRLGVVALGNVKYAPMSELTLRMLDVLHDHSALPDAGGDAAVPESLAVMARRLVDLLMHWTEAAADELFADNVALDEPYHRRAAAAAAARLDTVEIERLDASTAASAVITLSGATADRVIVSFDLAPIRPARIQWYTIETRPG
jgi:CubicO group peptidase (beta-lactamase class C family)